MVPAARQIISYSPLILKIARLGGILVCIGLQQLSPELAPSHSFGCDVHKIKIVGNGVSQKAVISDASLDCFGNINSIRIFRF